MIQKRVSPLMFASLLSALCVPVAFAHDPLDSMRSCAAEANDARRLSCYDQAMAELESELPIAVPQSETGTTSPGNRAEAVPPAPSMTPQSPEEEFGMSDKLEREIKKSSGDEAEEIKQLSSTVSDVSHRPRGELLITLENGQIWVETKPSSYFPLKVGDTVKIRRRAFGSFRLTEPSGRSTQVRRVQ